MCHRENKVFTSALQVPLGDSIAGYVKRKKRQKNSAILSGQMTDYSQWSLLGVIGVCCVKGSVPPIFSMAEPKTGNNADVKLDSKLNY